MSIRRPARAKLDFHGKTLPPKPRPRRFKLIGRPKAARPSTFDKKPMALGFGDREEARRLAASKLMNDSIRIKFQDEISP
jgi:hypothetical protein